MSLKYQKTFLKNSKVRHSRHGMMKDIDGGPFCVGRIDAVHANNRAHVCVDRVSLLAWRIGVRFPSLSCSIDADLRPASVPRLASFLFASLAERALIYV